MSLLRTGSLTISLLLVAVACERRSDLPTHPSSPFPDPPAAEIANPVVWIWSGGLEPRAVRVRARIARPAATATWRVRTVEGPPVDREVPARPTDLDPTILGGEIVDLEPGREWQVSLEVDGELDEVRRLRFSTPREGPLSFRVALGSCASTGSDGQVFDRIREEDPLFFLHLGDAHYENLESPDPAAYVAALDRVLRSPAQARLYRSVPVEYVWDDHDFGPNNSDSTHGGRDAVARAWRAVVPHRPLVVPAPTGPIHRSFVLGRTRWVIVDARAERDPRSDPDGPAKTLLGEAQKRWLRAEIEAAAAFDQVLVWVNTVSWISEPAESRDNWGGYTHERAEIASWIEPLVESGQLPGLVMLSGDAHMLAYDDGRNNTYGPKGLPLFPVLQAAALDRGGSIKGGPYSEGPFPGGGHYGILEVEDDGDGIRMRFAGRTWDRAELFSHVVDFAVPGPDATSGRAGALGGGDSADPDRGLGSAP